MQRDRVLEQHHAGGGDVEVAIDRHRAVKRHIVGVVQRSAYGRPAQCQGVQRIKRANIARHQNIAGRLQVKGIRRAVAIAIQEVRGRAAQLYLTGTTSACCQRHSAVYLDGVKQQYVSRHRTAGGRYRRRVARAFNNQRRIASQG